MPAMSSVAAVPCPARRGKAEFELPSVPFDRPSSRLTISLCGKPIPGNPEVERWIWELRSDKLLNAEFKSGSVVSGIASESAP